MSEFQKIISSFHGNYLFGYALNSFSVRFIYRFILLIFRYFTHHYYSISNQARCHVGVIWCPSLQRSSAISEKCMTSNLEQNFQFQFFVLSFFRIHNARYSRHWNRATVVPVMELSIVNVLVFFIGSFCFERISFFIFRSRQ